MTKASIYIAAPYASRDRFKSIVAELARLDFRVTSSWLEEKTPINEGTVGAGSAIDAKAAAAHVRQDLRDIDACGILVAFTEAAANITPSPTTPSSGGRHVETGYAIAKGKHVILVGSPENIFHRTLAQAKDWHAALIEILAWVDEQPRGERVS